MIKQFAKPLLNPITRLLEFGVIQGSKNWVNNQLAAYAKKRDLKVQVASLKSQIENEPADITLHAKLADCYAELALVKEAISTYRYVFDNKPDDTAAFDYLLNQYLLQNMHDKAQALLDQYQCDTKLSIIQTTLDELERFNSQISVQIAAENTRKKRKQLHVSKQVFTELIRYSLTLSVNSDWQFDSKTIRNTNIDYQAVSSIFADIAQLYADTYHHQAQANNLELSIKLDAQLGHFNEEKLLELSELLYIELNNPHLAESDLLTLLSKAPNNGLAHLHLARIYAYELNKLDTATQYYLKALELLPNNAKIHFHWAEFNRKVTFDKNTAKKHYLIALDLNPHYSECLESLGKLYHHYFYDFEQAKHYYVQAIMCADNPAGAYSCLGQLLAKEFKQPHLGLRYCEQAINLSKSTINLTAINDLIDAYNVKGYILHVILKNTAEALTNYQQARILSEQFKQHRLLSHTLQQLGQLELIDLQNPTLAEDYFKQALHYNSRNTDAMRGLALTYQKLGQYEKSKNTFEELLVISPDNSMYHRDFADLLRGNLNNINLAIEHYRIALQLNLNNYEAKHGLALALWRKNGTVAAKKLLLECINLEPERYQAHLNLALLLEKHFYEPELELKCLQTGIELYPSHPQANLIRDRIAELQQIVATSDELPQTIVSPPRTSYAHQQPLNTAEQWHYNDATKTQYETDFYGKNHPNQ